MFEGLPLEAMIGVGAFILSMVLLALIHGVSSAVATARESRREAARLVEELNALVGAVEKGAGPRAPGTPGAPRPLRRRKQGGRHTGNGRKVVPGPAPKQPYGPRSLARV